MKSHSPFIIIIPSTQHIIIIVLLLLGLGIVLFSRLNGILLKVVSRTLSNPGQWLDMCKVRKWQMCLWVRDSWANTSFVGKHDHIDSYIDGWSVTAKGFASNLPELKNIPIVNCSFAYNDEHAKTYRCFWAKERCEVNQQNKHWTLRAPLKLGL
jgi:hypothetical protein